MNPNTKGNHTAPHLKRICVIAAVFPCCLLAAILCWQRGKPVQGQGRGALSVGSAGFSNGGAIPRQFTCDDADLSPELHWQPAPADTKSIAVVMDDPDAPVDFTHWLVYNLPPGVRELPQGATRRGAAEGVNSFGRIGYGGPCPPRGNPHHYVFRVYALDRMLDLPAGATRRQVDAAMSGHVLAQGQIVGIYQSMGQ
jgi:Raf kinase inhibitor-like YbhB/YbcL family protein